MATYIINLSVPAGTTAAGPVEETVTLPSGVLAYVAVFFPPGPQGEVGVRLLHNRSQFYPSRVGQWAAWDSGQIQSRVNLPLGLGDADIVIQGKSPDANFDHEITVKLDVEAAAPVFDPVGLTDGMDRALRLLEGE